MTDTTCPTTTHTADGISLVVVGCGATVPDVRDDEGLVDCPKCGIWFDPEEELSNKSAAAAP